MIVPVPNWTGSNMPVTALPPAPKLAYSVSEACALTSLGRSTLYTLIATGRLHTRRIGGRRLIPADSLKTLISGEG